MEKTMKKKYRLKKSAITVLVIFIFLIALIKFYVVPVRGGSKIKQSNLILFCANSLINLVESSQ